MAATGRPTKLDDLTAKRICDAVATGTTQRCATEAAGVSYATRERAASQSHGPQGDVQLRCNAVIFGRNQRALWLPPPPPAG